MRLVSRQEIPGSITATPTALRRVLVAALAFVLPALSLSEVHSQEARRRWERMWQIRKDKFDLILSRIGQIGFLIGDKRAGLFNFEIAWVKAVKEG